MRLAAKFILISVVLVPLVLAGCGGSDGDSNPGTPPAREPVTEQITSNDVFEGNPVFSPDGNWYLYEAVADSNWDIWRLRTTGDTMEQLTSDPAFDSAPVWSPDGSSIAFESDRSGNKDIWVLDVDQPGAVPIQLTFTDGDEGSPCWAPDNTRIAFESNFEKVGGSDIYTVPVGGGDLSRVTETPDYSYCRTADWSPDSSQLVYESDAGGFSALYVVTSTGGTPTQITPTSGYEGHPAWSPDGASIAFESTRLGLSQIFVVAAEGGELFQVTTGGGWWPDWSPDGTEIVYGNFVGEVPNIWTVAVDW
jgi:TolB protein